MVKRRSSIGVGFVVLGCAVVMAAGCSSDDKKSVPYVAEGGEAGVGGGVSATPEGGAAGAIQSVSEAGQGGSGEAPGAAGAAGTPSCIPTGSAAQLAPTVLATPPNVCRGARALTHFTGNTDEDFSCCGVSNTATPYALTVTGEVTEAAGSDLLTIVPADAPLGATSIKLTCVGGPVAQTVDFNVIDQAPPVVTSADASIHSGQALHVLGTNLQGVTSVTAIPVSGAGSVYPCLVGTDITATALTCTFPNAIATGQYYIAAMQDGCGYAVYTPEVTVLPPT